MESKFRNIFTRKSMFKKMSLKIKLPEKQYIIYNLFITVLTTITTKITLEKSLLKLLTANTIYTYIYTYNLKKKHQKRSSLQLRKRKEKTHTQNTKKSFKHMSSRTRKYAVTADIFMSFYVFKIKQHTHTHEQTA